MKKIMIFAAFAAALSLASCQKEGLNEVTLQPYPSRLYSREQSTPEPRPRLMQLQARFHGRQPMKLQSPIRTRKQPFTVLKALTGLPEGLHLCTNPVIRLVKVHTLPLTEPHLQRIRPILKLPGNST